MVEHVEEAGVEFEIGMLTQLDVLEDGQVTDVRNGIGDKVARNISERRSENALRFRSIHDEAHRVFCHCSR